MGTENPSSIFERLLQEGAVPHCYKRLKSEISMKYKKYFLIVSVFKDFEKQGYGISSVVEDLSDIA